MDKYEGLRNELDECFKRLTQKIDESFMIMDSTPNDKNEIIDIWKEKTVSFINYIYKTSDKYNNKDVFKAITKALIFNK